MSEITSSREYLGTITRQELVDYCQDAANKLFVEYEREQTILERDTKTMSDEQFETLTFSSHTILGYISAYRDITEWAKKQVEKERESA